MKQQLYRRLAQLEKVAKAFAHDDRADPGESAREKIRQYLVAWGIEQSPQESLAETFARALGISTQELRSRLRARACES